MEINEATGGSVGFSRTAGVLIAVALTLLTGWVLGSGLSRLPTELYFSGATAELELPYRGWCRGLEVSSQGRGLPIQAADVHSGLARLSLPLAEGRHELQIHFDTVIPGWRRSYPLTVVIDSTAPVLSLDLKSVWSQASSSSLEQEIAISGRTEPTAIVSLNDKVLAVDSRGNFSRSVSLQPGWNRLALRVEDRAGNRVQRNTKVFFDTVAPEINWRTAPAQVFSTPSARLELLVQDDGPLAGVSATVGSKTVAWHRKPDNLWLGITDKLREGRHQVEVKVADAAGRVATSRREIVIDSSEHLGDADLGLGARGEDVVELHRRLLAAGYLESDPGSVFTKATEDALKTFQADEGFEASGIANHHTIVALGPRLIINLSAFALVLERPGLPDRHWSIASGSEEYPTPTGRFEVYEKVIDPTWLPPKSEWAKDAKPVEPGPDNPLGTRWIGLDWGEVGIHGTNAPWTVGSAVSHGCLRMETAQVEELFTLVEVGTPVIIFEGSEHHPLVEKFWPKG